jgi:hypothetical protein
MYGHPMTPPKLRRKSRTYIANLVMLALVAAESKIEFLQPLLGVNVYQLVAFGIPILNLILREVTSGPVGSVLPAAGSSGQGGFANVGLIAGLIVVAVFVGVIGLLVWQKDDVEEQLSSCEQKIGAQNIAIQKLASDANAAQDGAARAALAALVAGARRHAAIDPTQHGPAAMNQWIREVAQ